MSCNRNRGTVVPQLVDIFGQDILEGQRQKLPQSRTKLRREETGLEVLVF